VTRVKSASVDTLTPIVGKGAAEIIVQFYEGNSES